MCSPAASNVITDLARKIRCYLRYYNKAGEADQLELSQSGASNEYDFELYRSLVRVEKDCAKSRRACLSKNERPTLDSADT
jgi:hypothetical protein